MLLFINVMRMLSKVIKHTLTTNTDHTNDPTKGSKPHLQDFTVNKFT